MLFSLQLCIHGVLALCLYMCVRKEKVQEKFMLSWGFHIHCSSGCQEQRIHQVSLPIHRRQKKRNRQTKLQMSNATQDHNNNSRLTTPWMRPHEWACDHCSFPQTSQSKSIMLLEHEHQRPKPPLWLTKSDTPELQAHKQKAFKTNSSSMVGKRDCLLQVEIFWHSPAPRQGQREKSLRWWWSSNKNWVVSTTTTTTTQHNPIHKNKRHLKYKSKEQIESNLYTKNNNSYTPTKPTMQTNPVQKYPRLNFDIETLSSFCSLNNMLCFFFSWNLLN